MGALKASSRARLKRGVSSLLAAVFLSTTVLANVSPTWASGPVPAPRPTASSKSQAAEDTSPTVVRELESSRTADSSTYLMSDNTYETKIYAGPVHYQDDGGAWKDIDASLVPTQTPGIAHTKASDFDETFASDDVTANPVTVAHDDWSMSMKLIGGEQSSPMALGNSADYPFAMTDTRLEYEASGQALKDTLVLSSKNAPSTFTFFVGLKNLSLYTSPGGGYAFVDSDGKLAGRIDPLKVYDSATDAEGLPSSVCTSATMTAVSAPGGAYVTYSVPRGWLDDPARVYPVSVDPTYGFGVSVDTFASSGQTTTKYRSEPDLEAGYIDSSRKTCRSLVKFEMSAIPPGAIVSTAKLQLYCLAATGSNAVHVDPATVAWDSNATWSSTFGPYPSMYDDASGDTITVSSTGMKYWNNLGTAVKGWYDGTRPNYGLVIKDYPDNAAGTSCRFASLEYTSASCRPVLTVGWSTVTATVENSVYRPGDTVRATVTVNKPATTDAIHNVQLKVVGKNAQGADVNCGRFIWTDSDPSGWTGYQIHETDDGAWFAYDPAFGGATVTPKLDQCTTSIASGVRTVNFVYTIGPSYGDVQNNRLMASCYELMGNTYRDTGASFSVLPATSGPVSVSTTASTGWWTASAGNDDTNTAGRGAVRLSWPSEASATGYYVYLFNGNTYEKVATTTATSWNSASGVHFPSDSAIASLPGGYTGSCLATGALDLRDDPRALYAKTAGTAWDNVPSYAFKVVTYNSAGASAVSDNATVAVTLDNRTSTANDDTRHTSFDLGQIAGQPAEALLDDGTLGLSATDLDIDSYGPAASLSRSYDSGDKASRDFGGPGWRFSYEQDIVSTSTTSATYFDEAGDAHRFTRVGPGPWTSANGDYDMLAGNSTDGWTLTLKDRSVLRFSAGPDAPITSVTDANGQATTYDSSANPVTIKAANAKTITVDLSGDGDAHATYSADGVNTRKVDYHYEAAEGGHAATATVTYSFSGSPATPGYSVDYLYTDSVLTGVRLNTLSKLAHQPAASAAWDFDYLGTRIATVTAPYYTDTDRATTSIDATTDPAGLWLATVTRSGEVSGSVSAVVESFGINRTGTLAYKTNPRKATDPVDTWTYTYSATNEQASETNPADGVKSSALDAHGNVIAERDEAGRQTLSTYDAFDQLITSTDQRGSVTTNHYDAANGNLLSADKTLNAAGDTARTEYDYDALGRKSHERKKLSEDPATGLSHWLETTYDYDKPIDEPGTVTKSGKKRYKTDAPGSFTADPIDLGGGVTKDSLVTSDVHDDWGDKTRHTDARNVDTEKNDAYDLAGRLLSSTDAADVTSWHVYDVLGNETASWQSAKSASDGTTITANYRETSFDPLGHTTQGRLYRTNGDVSRKVDDRVTDHTFDALGRETLTEDSFVTGNPAKSWYDARGNVVKSWVQGLAAYDEPHASGAHFDPQGRQDLESAPSTNAAITTTRYNADGSVKSVTGADGSVTSYAYDPVTGDKTTETNSSGTTTYAYDIAGRLVSQTDAAGSKTTSVYDLADRQTNATGDASGDGSGSTTTYNALDWVLVKTDADKVATLDTYDENGRTLSEQTGTDPKATSRFDDAGHLWEQHSADGTVTRTFDEFGRTKTEIHQTAQGTVKNVLNVFDSLGRAKSSTDDKNGIVRTYDYQTAPGGTSSSATTYGSLTTTTTIDSSGKETTRETTIPLVGSLTRSIDSTDPAGRATGSTFAGGVIAQSRFDTGGRLARQWGSGLTASDPGTDTYTFEDVTGRKHRDNLQLNCGGTTDSTYGYTADGRLASVTGSAPGSFSFDTAGNVTTYTASTASGTLSGTLGYDANNRLLKRSIGGSVAEVYAFDGNGRRVSQGPPANPCSVVASYTGTGGLRSWDTSAGVHASYSYDALGQRNGSVVRNGSVTTTTSYTYDGLNLLALSSKPSDAPTYTIAYLYAANGRPYAGVYQSGTATPCVFGMVTTDRGDVVALTNTSGGVFASYRYDSWGRPLSSTSQAAGSVVAAVAGDIAARQPLRYAGYSYDAESAMYYLSARTYDPATMQFLQKDPAKADCEESAYQYCGGNPVSMVDRSGARELSTGWVNMRTLEVAGSTGDLGAFATLEWRVNVIWNYNKPRIQVGVSYSYRLRTNAGGASEVPDAFGSGFLALQGAVYRTNGTHYSTTYHLYVITRDAENTGWHGAYIPSTPYDHWWIKSVYPKAELDLSSGIAKEGTGQAKEGHVFYNLFGIHRH